MVKIISISGLDGSGKTTQIELLRKQIEASGGKTFYFHATNASILNRLKRFLQRPNDQSGDMGVTTANWFGISVRKIALPIDIWLFQNRLKKLNDSGYSHVVSDRYFYDSLVHISYLQSKNRKFINKYIEKIPKPDAAFLLNISPEKILERDRSVSQGAKYLEAKKHLYEEIFSLIEAINVDATKSTSQINRFICSNIGKS